MRAGIFRLAAAALSVVSCKSATEPLSNVSAVVLPETVARNLESSSGRVDVSLRFSISNPTSGPIYYAHCSASLERHSGGLQWEMVASTICLAYAPANPLDGTLMIPAGESREAGAFMSGRYGEGGLPSTVPEGTYRVHFSILSPLPDVWRGVTGIELTSRSFFTDEFTLGPAPN